MKSDRAFALLEAASAFAAGLDHPPEIGDEVTLRGLGLVVVVRPVAAAGAYDPAQLPLFNREEHHATH